jgi:hypothetical protein
MYFSELVSSARPDRDSMRVTLGLRSAPAAGVRYLADAPVCERAVSALNQLLKTPGAPRRVWLIALGPAFAIEDPSEERPGRDSGIFVFNLDFQHLGTLHGF